MALNYSIPKTSTFLSTSSTFTALFGNPTPGVYDFNRTANAGRVVLNLNMNAIYLINRITIAGDISQEEYLNNILTLPLMVLRYGLESQRVYPMSIPLVQYNDNMEAVAFFWSDLAGETLTLDLVTGVINQDAFMVGRGSVTLNVAMAIFEITDNGFVQNFRSDNSMARTGNRTNLQARELFYTETRTPGQRT
jgi:hypothetical protein